MLIEFIKSKIGLIVLLSIIAVFAINRLASVDYDTYKIYKGDVYLTSLDGQPYTNFTIYNLKNESRIIRLYAYNVGFENVTLNISQSNSNITLTHNKYNTSLLKGQAEYL